MAKQGNKKKGLSSEEIEAMKEHIQELNSEKNEGEEIVLGKIAKMVEPDRALARRVHSIVMASEPGLVPRLWYGMPAYSMDGKLICFFQDAHKFKARYATLGFSDKANLDEGSMWPVVFAVMDLSPTNEARIRALVRKAVSR